MTAPKRSSQSSLSCLNLMGSVQQRLSLSKPLSIYGQNPELHCSLSLQSSSKSSTKQQHTLLTFSCPGHFTAEFHCEYTETHTVVVVYNLFMPSKIKKKIKNDRMCFTMQIYLLCSFCSLHYCLIFKK